jgi:hypothetical protein
MGELIEVPGGYLLFLGAFALLVSMACFWIGYKQGYATYARREAEKHPRGAKGRWVRAK